ncbi:FimB/Mfa2 family fimbrial subunit [Bacteroides sp. ET71]|uniref:FimB/Mfa2 family fimbrial subunit n=1 Tax=Bacteroides sp. ET71 TaxID=2939421 RepID=UPI002010CE62|nr:FimB/Mfa2 family fimbrial subunit [Bacteroides sp. ET71]MCL1615284.1 FimB/Mfa2 family fimbrial subunit [Bacteroides sp. ET71]
MKKLLFLATLALLAVGCDDDSASNGGENTELIAPALYMNVVTGDGDKPFTGVLSIAPCTEGTSIYYGNYVNSKLSPFYGYYFVQNGELYASDSNRELYLPLGNYEMLYWGTPKYEEPIYAYPAVREPTYNIGGDLAQQDFSLLKMSDTDAYYPTYDLVFACHRVTVGAEDLDAALKRVVAGLKVILKDKDNQVLSTEITNVEVRVTNIYEKLNAYTAEPHGDPCTVSFPLVRSTDGLQMSNGIVMLFPSAGIPELQLNISLADGQVKHISQQLKQPLEANNKLTLTISIGDIFEEEGSGSITVDEWNENHEEIDVPVLQ